MLPHAASFHPIPPHSPPSHQAYNGNCRDESKAYLPSVVKTINSVGNIVALESKTIYDDLVKGFKSPRSRSAATYFDRMGVVAYATTALLTEYKV